MSSIVQAQGILFCEGTANSHDYFAYDKLVAPHGGAWMSLPAGGKRSIVNYARGQLSEADGGHIGRRWAVLRDRDMDFEPDATAIRCVERNTAWRVFTTHRAEVENYLIEPRLMHRYWSEMAAKVSGWKYRAPPSLDEMRAQLANAARSLIDHQAFVWALKRMWFQHTRPPWTEPKLGTLCTQPGGLAAVDFGGLIEKLLLDVPNHRPTSPASEARATFEAHRARFRAQAFFDDEQHLVWFKGKHLRQALQSGPKPKWPVEDEHLTKIASEYLALEDFDDLAAMSKTLASIQPHRPDGGLAQ